MLQRRSCSEGSKTAAMPCSQRSTDVQRSSQSRSRLQDSRSCEEINLWNKMEEIFENYQHTPQLEQVGHSSKRCSNSTSHHRTSCSGPAKYSSSPISMRCFKKELESAGVKKGVPCVYTAESSRQNQKDVATNFWNSKSVQQTGIEKYVLPRDSMDRISPTNPRPSGCTERIDRDLQDFSGSAQYKSMDNKSKEFGVNDVASNYDGECQDENMHETNGPNSSLAGSRSACNLYPEQEKGKEKDLYSDEDCASAVKESDDSNESVESYPSTKLISKRKRASCSNSMMPLGSKKSRKGDNESACSRPLHTKGSSFLNWISKLTNGQDMFDKPASHGRQLSVVARKDCGSPAASNEDNKMVPLRTVGFGSLFQSLYSRDMMISSRKYSLQSGINNTGHAANQLNFDSKHSSSSSSGGNLVRTERLRWGNLHFISGSEAGMSQNQLGVLPLRAVNVSSGNNNFLTEEKHGSTLPCTPGNPGLSSGKSSSGNLEGKVTEICGCSSNSVDGRGEFLESFWITRLLPKVPTTLQEPEPCNMDTDCPFQKPDGVANAVNKDCGTEADYNRESADEKVTPNISLIMPLQEVKKSETTASIFASRLGVLRHVKHSTGQCSAACQPGPSEVNNVGSKSNSFIMNCGSRDKLETSPESNNSPTKDRRMVLLSEGKQEDQHDVSGHRDSQEFRAESEHELHTIRSSKLLAPHVSVQETNPVGEYCGENEAKVEEIHSSSREKISNRNEIIPYCSSIPNNVPDNSLAILEAVRRLRLSRTDIVRWLKSPTTYATLDGFFLRLRLGKLEEALGDTGYHVARINGATDDNSLSVSIRNSKCLVDPRFVSNSDFLEDELKAWWSSILKGDCKLPSKEELNNKLSERELFR